jgi:hypothetical protein
MMDCAFPYRGERLTPIQAIRRFCWACMGAQEEGVDIHGKRIARYVPHDDVAACTVTECFLHPYRTGRNPNASKKRSPAQLAATAALVRKHQVLGGNGNENASECVTGSARPKAAVVP